MARIEAAKTYNLYVEEPKTSQRLVQSSVKAR